MSIDRAELHDLERTLRDLNHRLDRMEWGVKMRHERQVISLVVAVVVVASVLLMTVAVVAAR